MALNEVAVCFGGKLMRGNRAQKVNSSNYQVHITQFDTRLDEDTRSFWCCVAGGSRVYAFTCKCLPSTQDGAERGCGVLWGLTRGNRAQKVNSSNYQVLTHHDEHMSCKLTMVLLMVFK
jgi:hypothetical protein